MSSYLRPAHRRRGALAIALMTVAGTGVVALPAPAEAAITTLCSGYTSCAAKGMSNAGYAAVARSSFWRMYSGHNCTNYAAYRMIEAGASTSRPWTGGGNATNWGTQMSSITNGVPRVGAVAWWKAGVRPAGSAGHVAYVEQVVSADEIILSQDSWSGDFSWTRVTRSGGGWPSGFVHFKDVALRATAASRVTGIAKVGGVLSAVSPTFSPAATQVAYQWMQNGTAIAGATSATYTPSISQQGKAMSVRVTGTRMGYPAAVATSAATSVVLPGTLRATTSPTARGTSQLGRVLSATAGAWTPTPSAVRYRWLSGGNVVQGATRSTFVPSVGAVGRSLAVQVIASRSGYADVVKTLTYPTVAPGVLPAVAAPSMAGTARLGRTLQVKLPRVPAGARAAVQWVRADNGRVVRSGSTTYRLGAADLGTRVVARALVTRAGYRTRTVTSRPTPRVRTTPIMRVATARGTRGLAVYLSLRAPGLSQLTGQVVVRSRGRIVAKVPVRAGVGRAVVRRLPHGRSTVRFTYVQTGRVASTSVQRAVRLPR